MILILLTGILLKVLGIASHRILKVFIAFVNPKNNKSRISGQMTFDETWLHLRRSLMLLPHILATFMHA